MLCTCHVQMPQGNQTFNVLGRLGPMVNKEQLDAFGRFLSLCVRREDTYVELRGIDSSIPLYSTIARTVRLVLPLRWPKYTGKSTSSLHGIRGVHIHDVLLEPCDASGLALHSNACLRMNGRASMLIANPFGNLTTLGLNVARIAGRLGVITDPQGERFYTEMRPAQSATARTLFKAQSHDVSVSQQTQNRSKEMMESRLKARKLGDFTGNVFGLVKTTSVHYRSRTGRQMNDQLFLPSALQTLYGKFDVALDFSQVKTTFLAFILHCIFFNAVTFKFFGAHANIDLDSFVGSLLLTGVPLQTTFTVKKRQLDRPVQTASLTLKDVFVRYDRAVNGVMRLKHPEKKLLELRVPLPPTNHFTAHLGILAVKLRRHSVALGYLVANKALHVSSSPTVWTFVGVLDKQDAMNIERLVLLKDYTAFRHENYTLVVVTLEEVLRQDNNYDLLRLSADVALNKTSWWTDHALTGLVVPLYPFLFHGSTL